MDWACSKCGALHWLNERIEKTRSMALNPLFSMCCSDGKIQLPAPPPPPEPLQQLFSASTVEAREFRSNIHQYNASLSFTLNSCRLPVQWELCITERTALVSLG